MHVEALGLSVDGSADVSLENIPKLNVKVVRGGDGLPL